MYISALKTRRAETSFESHDANDTIRRADVTTRFPYLTPQQLAHWAYKKIGPSYRLIGRDAVYRVCDIEAYVRSIAKHVEAAPQHTSAMTAQKRKPMRKP